MKLKFHHVVQGREATGSGIGRSGLAVLELKQLLHQVQLSAQGSVSSTRRPEQTWHDHSTQPSDAMLSGRRHLAAAELPGHQRLLCSPALLEGEEQGSGLDEAMR